MGSSATSALPIPRVTYTDPEIAQVGLTEDEAARRGVAVRAFEVPLEEVDRALTDGEADGFVKILTRRNGDQIGRATIVASHAGEMLNEITAAMVNGLGLRRLSDVIHPYPTQAEAIRKVADQYAQGRIGGRLKWLLNKWLSWRA